MPIGEDKGRIRVARRRAEAAATVAGDGHSVDDKILAVALELLRTRTRTPTVFVTKDTNLRIRADALGLHAEDYDVEGSRLDELWSGVAELDVSPEQVNDFYANGALPLSSPGARAAAAERVRRAARPHEPQHSAVGKYSAAKAGVRAAHQDAEGGGLGDPARATRSSPSRSISC